MRGRIFHQMTQPLEFLLQPEATPRFPNVLIYILCFFAISNIVAHSFRDGQAKVLLLYGSAVFAVLAAFFYATPTPVGVERVAIFPGRAELYKFDGQRVVLRSESIENADFVAGQLVFSLKDGSVFVTQYVPPSQRVSILQAVADVLFTDDISDGASPPQKKINRFSDVTVLKI